MEKTINMGQYGKKITLLFVLLAISTLFAPVAGGLLSDTTVNAIQQILVFIEDEKIAKLNEEAVRGYEAQAQKAEKTLLELKDTIYAPDNLQNAIAEEILKSGIAVENFSVKNIPAANRRKAISPSANWNNFDFAAVSLNGTIPSEKLSALFLFLSSRQKLWHVSAFEFRPLDAPADLVSRFRKIDNEIVQGRTFERNSILDTIEKRLNKKMFAISLSFFVPIDGRAK